MSVTNNILRVQNTQGIITSVKDRGADAKLINQEYDEQLSITQNSKWSSDHGYEELNSSDTSVFSFPSDKPFKSIPLDVVVTYSSEMSSTVTSNPVQTGINVNDHVYNNPDTVTVKFGISDIRGSLARLSGVVKSFTSIDSLKNPVSPSRALLNLLCRAKEEHTLLALDDGLHTYTNMVITNISYDKDKSTYRTLVATATLQQFIFVDTVENGSKRPAVVPGNASTFSDIWDKITAIRLV